jgi:hypothetical protein
MSKFGMLVALPPPFGYVTEVMRGTAGNPKARRTAFRGLPGRGCPLRFQVLTSGDLQQHTPCFVSVLGNAVLPGHQYWTLAVHSGAAEASTGWRHEWTNLWPLYTRKLCTSVRPQTVQQIKQPENLKERNHLGNLVVNGSERNRMWGCGLDSTGSGCGLVVGSNKRRRISWLADWLSASQEGLSSMELVISLGSDLPENTPHPSYKAQSVYV